MCSLQIFDWRKDMESLVDKNDHILSTGLFSDVSFAVGSTKEVIKGHKIILMAGSRVFQELLEDKKDEKIIQIPQIEPKEFKQLLKHIYTGVDNFLTEDDFDYLPFLKAVKYFEVETFLAKCVQISFKFQFITIQNALGMYEEFKHNLKIDRLTEASRIFIMVNANEILKESSFLTISSETLQYFLSLDNFLADEVQLCLAVYKWGEAECLRQSLEKTDENMRKVLKEAIPLIRFLRMKPYEFSKLIGPLNILTPDQQNRILHYFNLKPEERESDKQLGFSSRPRQNYSDLCITIDDSCTRILEKLERIERELQKTTLILKG